MDDLLIRVRSGTKIMDNVTVILTDEITGKQRIITDHNAGQPYTLSALSQWISGKNNTGYQPVFAPTKCQLGSGGVAGTFVPIAGSLVNLNAATPNSPAPGTTTFLFQTPAGIVTTTVTQAQMTDINGNVWFLTQFPASFTPSNTENITVNWETTFSN